MEIPRKFNSNSWIQEKRTLETKDPMFDGKLRYRRGRTMKRTSVRHMWALFCLPLVMGSNPNSAPGLTTVLILLFILLLLLILLFFSWHKLNLATDGQYHPRNLWQGGSDGEEGGGAIASLAGAVAGRWRALRARVSGESSDHLSQSEDNTQPEPTGALGPKHTESAGENQDGQDTQDQSENDETDEDDYSAIELITPASMETTEEAGISTKRRLSNSPMEDTAETLLPTETKESSDASAGHSEAMIPGQQAFAGAELWEDSSLEAGSVSIHVSVL